MTTRTVDLYECDGPCNPLISEADTQGLQLAPVGWVTLILPGYKSLHLCPACDTPEGLLKLAELYTGMRCRVCGSRRLLPDPAGYYVDATDEGGAPYMCSDTDRHAEALK